MTDRKLERKKSRTRESESPIRLRIGKLLFAKCFRTDLASNKDKGRSGGHEHRLKKETIESDSADFGIPGRDDPAYGIQLLEKPDLIRSFTIFEDSVRRLNRKSRSGKFLSQCT